jgi:hypothetical protein
MLFICHIFIWLLLHWLTSTSKCLKRKKWSIHTQIDYSLYFSIKIKICISNSINSLKKFYKYSHSLIQLKSKIYLKNNLNHCNYSRFLSVVNHDKVLFVKVHHHPIRKHKIQNNRISIETYKYHCWRLFF